MKIEDFGEDEVMARLVTMVREMASASDPRESIAAYLRGYVKHLWPGMSDHVHLITRGLSPGQYRVFFVSHDLDNLDPERFPHPESLPVHKTGFFSELIRTGTPKFVSKLEIEEDPVVGDMLSAYRSVFAFPVFGPRGIDEWIFVFRKDEGADLRHIYEQNLIQSNLLSAQNRAIIATARLREATEHIQREVEQIAAIQRALLPEGMPEIQGVSLAADYATFDRAGGDYYDFIALRRTPAGPDARGPWAILIADASGHGPAAAVVVAMLHTLVHSHHGQFRGPAQFLEHLNEHLQSKRIGGAFVTAWLGIYNPLSRELRYASAGHDAPILMAGGDAQAMRRLTNDSGFPLGICERVECSEASVVLEPGQTLVLYTDGITEARNPAGEMFQVEGIEAALRECNGMPDCVTLNVLDALRDHEAGRRPADDQTIVAMRVDE